MEYFPNTGMIPLCSFYQLLVVVEQIKEGGAKTLI